MSFFTTYFVQLLSPFNKRLLLLFAVFIGFCNDSNAQNYQIKGSVESVFGADKAAFVNIIVKGDRTYSVSTNERGEYIFRAVAAGKYTISFSSINFKPKSVDVNILSDTTVNVKLEPLQRLLDEVYVTASQTKGKASTSVIDRKAMELLQPSSFTDLLELLPGGRTYTPNLTQMNQIRLREPANAPSGYNTGSLGTAFYIDGAPMNTTANMQTTSGFTTTDPNASRNSVNRGIDMRSIPTDQIEKVEIVRGIPSVEFGDLTSGLVSIERRKGNTPYTARMKADGFSKLYSIGKGVSILEKNLLINSNVDFLDSKADPRDSYENYKRITASVRTEKFWENEHRKLIWSSALDYATNIDNERIDPDNSYALTDSYKSTYKNYSLNNALKFKFSDKKILKSLDFSAKVSYQDELIDISRWVQARSATVLANSLEEGAHYVNYVTPSYTAELDVEGKPFYLFLKGVSTLGFSHGTVKHQIRFGTEYNFSKNFGRGQIYDINFPLALNSVSSVRPRAYNDIPALQNLSFFAEDGAKILAGEHHIDITAGVRAMAMVGMDTKYDIANKFLLDPRVNAVWYLPKATLGGKKLEISFGSGFGVHHKLPTMDMLYPNKTYIDNIQLNYYHNNPDFIRANAKTTILNTENYALRAAQNVKWEINGDIDYDGNRLSITYFRESMASGFRPMSRYVATTYRLYDNSSIDAATLTSRPNVEDFAFKEMKEYYGYSISSNGSGTFKEGIEYQFTTKRFSSINTRFTINGAWFNNRYKSSVVNYGIISPTVNTDNKVRQYIGIYDEDEGTNYQQFNTNLTVDSYLPKLGLMFSASAQSLWFTSRQENYKTGVPIAYMDINGNTLPYTEASAKDPNLLWLLQNYSAQRFNRDRIPISLQVNIKASKDFRNNARISMFVSRFLTYTPSYTDSSNIRFIRRGASPYFGMELNFNL
ncbi:TonB-dependent receptor [Pedobacter xixiisoli]|uniref:TonB-dependent Receptor Plug Domain n=1 Tax=Pedobacter xixiisoli TaxID=1476464 RepID=A0A285ZRB2_9SPHI|nr:TonB-dependent receptor [Pedobacter xixiisoli]SOD12184.1 TonB-dependent Receptor Plug Domain [Pedobacter xixiisoli]